jgi:hypothetical protein
MARRKRLKKKRHRKRTPGRAEKRNLTFTIFAIVIFLGSVLGYALLSGGRFGSVEEPPLETGPGQVVPDMGNRHIQIGEEHEPYNSDPPTSGPHYPFLARWGIHNTSIPKELQVHNLEDGGVIVQYNCRELDPRECEELVQNLTRVVEGYPLIILAPYPEMDSVIALTAWGRIDKFDEFDEYRIRRFIEAYMGIDHHPR